MFSYVGTTLDGGPTCARAISARRRRPRGAAGARAGKNSYNVIEIEDQVIRIGQHMFLEDAGEFVAIAEHVFPRRSAGVYKLPRAKRVIEADMGTE